MLIGKDQHSVCRERVLDGSKVGRFEGSRQVDIADFSRKTGRDWTDSDGHEQFLHGHLTRLEANGAG